MKVKITTTKRVTEEIEVEFPYYYIHILTDYNYEESNILYGMKTEIQEITIKEHIRDKNNVIYEIEVDKRNDSYFHKNDTCTAKEFEEAKERAKRFINEL